MKKYININQIDFNEGQIEGVPRNPRFIKDTRRDKLRKSLLDDPEMMELRELLVVQNNKRFVILGGNMRFQVVKEIIEMPKSEFDTLVEERRDNHNFLDWMTAISLFRDKKEVPCKVIPSDTPVEKLRAIVIKDNVAFGQDDHDILANEWDISDLEDWGMDMSFLDQNLIEDFSEKNKEINPDNFSDVMTLKLNFSSDEYNLVLQTIGDKGLTPEEFVLNAIKNE